VARAVAKGCDLFDVLRAACLHPVQHYGLDVGQLQVGDPADFIIVNDLQDFIVRETWLNGQCVARDGQSLIPRQTCVINNHFKALPKTPEDFALSSAHPNPEIRIIEALDGEIVTKSLQAVLPAREGRLQADVKRDILKIAVVNRYAPQTKVAIGFVRGFGLQKGAIASSVAHDSHNIVAIGTDDHSLCAAVNAVIQAQGGVSATDGGGASHLLPLPIAGLMSPEDGYTLAQQYSQIDQWVKSELSCRLQAPFMVLSFLALPVIPDLKITDLGLFDVNRFAFTSVEIEEEQ
jgi:adenine deaminase